MVITKIDGFLLTIARLRVTCNALQIWGALARLNVRFDLAVGRGLVIPVPHEYSYWYPIVYILVPVPDRHQDSTGTEYRTGTGTGNYHNLQATGTGTGIGPLLCLIRQIKGR